MTGGGKSRTQLFALDQSFAGMARVAQLDGKLVLKSLHEIEGYFEYGERGPKCRATIKRARKQAQCLLEMVTRIDEWAAAESELHRTLGEPANG